MMPKKEGMYSFYITADLILIVPSKMGVRGLSNMIMQLRKLCNHPFVFEEVESAINPTKINNDSLWRTAGKFELLDRLLPKFFATNHKVRRSLGISEIK